MVSTITSTTVSILTTSAIAGSLATIGILVLIALLVQKEIVLGVRDSRKHQLSQALNIGILPLLIAFFLIVVLKVVEVLN